MEEIRTHSSDAVKLFVGQIPKDLYEESLRPYFEEFGPIAEVSIIRDNTTMTSKGCAFVTYLYPQSAQMAIETLHDKVKLPNSLNALQVRLAETQLERENKLFIGMLPKTMNEDDLNDIFAPYGDLREVHIIRGPEGSPKGCAFVKFIERDAAITAIEDLNGSTPHGGTRPLVVKFADTKKQPKPNTVDFWSMPSNGQQQRSAVPVHHQQQQRMMYPHFPVSPMSHMSHPQMVGVPFVAYGGGGPGSPMNAPSSPQQRFMYMPSSPTFFPSTGPPFGMMGNPGEGLMEEEARGGMKMGMMYPPSSGGGMNSRSGEKVGYNPAPSNRFNNPTTGPPNIPGNLVPPPPPDPDSSPEQEGNHIRPPEGPSGANLFIYHLPRDLTDADLATLFAPFGNVISAKVFVDKKTSDSKGFGFVSYDTLSSANAAIESMNGFNIGSKRLKVQHKRVAHSTSDDPAAMFMSGIPTGPPSIGMERGLPGGFQQVQSGYRYENRGRGHMNSHSGSTHSLDYGSASQDNRYDYGGPQIHPNSGNSQDFMAARSQGGLPTTNYPDAGGGGGLQYPSTIHQQRQQQQFSPPSTDSLSPDYGMYLPH